MFTVHRFFMSKDERDKFTSRLRNRRVAPHYDLDDGCESTAICRNAILGGAGACPPVETGTYPCDFRVAKFRSPTLAADADADAADAADATDADADELSICRRSVHGFADTAPLFLYVLYNELGVAAPVSAVWDKSPPAWRHAATSSAQNHDVPSLFLGQISDLAIPIDEKGFPTCLRANWSIALSCAWLQPMLTYEYDGLIPVRSASSCVQKNVWRVREGCSNSVCVCVCVCVRVRIPMKILTTPTSSLKTRSTFFILPPLPSSSPSAISTCVKGDPCAAAATRFRKGSPPFIQSFPTR